MAKAKIKVKPKTGAEIVKESKQEKPKADKTVAQAYLNATQAAKYIGVTPTTLRSLGIPYSRLSEKIIRYNVATLDAFIKERENEG